MTQTVGVVPLEGRGSLPFVDLHREVLFLHAIRALLDVDRLAGRVVATVEPGQLAAAVSALDRSDLPAMVEDADTWWRTLTGPLTLMLHDPLCPLVPAAFLSRCLDEAVSSADRDALVAFRPVTDTIKTVVDDRIVDTLDRDRFGIVASPLVFDHCPGADEPVPPTADFGALAGWLRGRGTVQLHRAPSLGRRVDDLSAVNLLECMDELARVVEET